MERTEYLNNAMIAPETLEVVPGVSVRRFSLRSMMLLSRVNNPLASLDAAQDPAKIPLHALVEFIYVHAEKLEIVEHFILKAPEMFLHAVSEFAEKIPLEKLSALQAEIFADLTAARVAQVNALADERGAPTKNAPIPAASQA